MLKENITITIERDTLDLIRKQAIKDYRSINKHITYLISLGLTVISEQQKGLK
jgi:hypothetical protein